MKKRLDVSNVPAIDDNHVATLGISVYENNNMRLTAEIDGKDFMELTVDIDHTLPLNWVALNIPQEPWIKRLILDNGLGNILVSYYKNGIFYPIYQLSPTVLKKFSLTEYDKYVYECAEHPQKATTKGKLLYRELKYHKWAVEHKDGRLRSQRKPRYKSTLKSRVNQRRYRNTHDAITAYLPKGMKAEIEQFGIPATQVLKKALLDYLDEQEKKGEQ